MIGVGSPAPIFHHPWPTMLESRFRSNITDKIQPTARFLVGIGITANMVTIAGFLLNVAAAICFGYGKLLASGILMLAGGSLDFVDGSIARARVIRDRSGALLDSVIDRYSEVALFIGAAVFFHLHGNILGLIMAVVTMSGSLLISYVRARAEGLQIECKVGLMQRPERIALLGSGLILDPLLGVLWGIPNLILLLAFGILALTTQWTAFHRLIYSFRELKRHPISE